MDRIASFMLEKICSLAPLGRYVIISADEFLECFPQDAEKSESEIRKALKSLIADGFVELKYSDGEMYCVAPLKKYVPEVVTPPAEVKAEATAEKPRESLKTFIAAFLGGMAGSLLISLIFALV